MNKNFVQYEKNFNQDIEKHINKKIDEIIKNDKKYEEINFLPTYISNKKTKNILVLSGGGIKGIALLGGLHALYKLNILKDITTFAGTSVGSLIAFLIILKYTPIDIFNFIKDYDLNKLKGVSITTLLDSYGLDTGEKIMKLIEDFMIKKNINIHLTLLDLFNLTNKIFYITVVNVNKQKVEYLSHITHPQLEVIKAVRMSISIPFIFTPVKYNDCMYIDGGCIDNYPIVLFNDQLDNVIGLCTTENVDNIKKMSSINDYAFNVLLSLINGITETSIKKYEKYTVQIIINNYTTIDFDLSYDVKKQLFDIGYNTLMKKFKFNIMI
jgi:NTE family protein